MNFYKHHLGDYDGDTAHLSWDEDMAYTRLLRACYRRERPIGEGEAYRLARANSRAQRAAVDSVLAEFFTKCADGWHNKRADEEIATYQSQADTNRRIANTRKRGRTVDEPLHESSNDPSTKGTPNQEPRTKNQEPEKNPKVAPMALPEWLNPEKWNAYVKTRPAKARTQAALQSALEKLERFRAAGDNPNEVVANSLANGWQGLFPVDRVRGQAPDYSQTIANLKD